MLLVAGRRLQPWAGSFVIQVTDHACERLMERFPQVEAVDYTDAELVIRQSIRTGWLLRTEDHERLFTNRMARDGSKVWCPSLGGIAGVRFEAGGIAVVRTVVIADFRKEWRRVLSQVEDNYAGVRA